VLLVHRDQNNRFKDPAYATYYHPEAIAWQWHRLFAYQPIFGYRPDIPAANDDRRGIKPVPLANPPTVEDEPTQLPDPPIPNDVPLLPDESQKSAWTKPVLRTVTRKKREIKDRTQPGLF